MKGQTKQSQKAEPSSQPPVVYKAGTNLYYKQQLSTKKGNDGTPTNSSMELPPANIIHVHYDDNLIPYYTIRLLDSTNREKQTDNDHLTLNANNDEDDQKKKEEEEEEEEEELCTLQKWQLGQVTKYVNDKKDQLLKTNATSSSNTDDELSSYYTEQQESSSSSNGSDEVTSMNTNEERKVNNDKSSVLQTWQLDQITKYMKHTTKQNNSNNVDGKGKEQDDEESSILTEPESEECCSIVTEKGHDDDDEVIMANDESADGTSKSQSMSGRYLCGMC